MARKKKNAKSMKNSLAWKVAKTNMKVISEKFQKANDAIGKFNDGDTNGDTLIGAAECFNADIHSGTKLTKWYSDFNNDTLPKLHKYMEYIDEALVILDTQIQTFESQQN